MGSQIAWLLPSALVLLVGGLWLTRGRTRTALALWGGWLVVTAAVFSFMNGIIHSYYTVALAPAIAAVVGIGATALWERRGEPVAAAVLSGSVALSALQCYLLINGFSTPVAVIVLVAGLIAAVGLVMSMRAAIPVALVAALLGPTTYSFATVTTPHTGALPVAGPSSGRMRGGGLLDATTPDAQVVSLLQDNATSYTWVAATIGSNNAAGLQLASGQPVMALGGFNGTDPAPTLEQFQEMVRNGQIHYFVDSTMMRGNSGSDAAHQIAEWVGEHYLATTVAGTTIYDLGKVPA